MTAPWLLVTPTSMPLTPRQKVRAYRRRKCNGRAVFKIEAHIASLRDLLLDAGFLREWDSEDRHAIEKALQQAVAVWSRA
jgi:hypothetical protein